MGERPKMDTRESVEPMAVAAIKPTDNNERDITADNEERPDDRKNGHADADNNESHQALRALVLTVVAAGAIAIVFAGHTGKLESFWSVASIGLLLLGTSSFIGGILGFLFGIPRTLQRESGLTTGSNPQQAAAQNEGMRQTAQKQAAETDTNYMANTNLEQISDWLTKILVGVGLTQVAAIQNTVATIVANVKPALGSDAYAGPFASCLILFGLIVGFLYGYLWTRLFLIGAFRRADSIGTLTAQIKKVSEKADVAERKVDELKRKGQLDAMALNLVDQQLTPHPGSARPDQKAIDEAVLSASNSVKAQIYYRARDLRSKTWSDPSSKATMELTIPIFRALIASDPDRKHHENHGQLGYALKDKAQPDYVEAEREFTTAIDIRKSAAGWGFYELCRAMCIIQRDANFSHQQQSDRDTIRRVAADLKKSFQDDDAWQIGSQDNVIADWCLLNKIDIKSLKQI